MRKAPEPIDPDVFRIFDLLRRGWPGQGRWNEACEKAQASAQECCLSLGPLQVVLGRLRSCRRRDYRAAVVHLTQRLRAQLDRVSWPLSVCQAQLQQLRYEPAPGLWRLWHEIEEACAGYRLRLSRDHQLLIATTEPIVLTDGELSEDLGPMEIRIPVQGFATQRRQLSIAALEPRECNGHIHPHVSTDGHLCEGEAAVPLAQAWRAGLLAELLHIVDVTLRTYNRHSPYEPLERWSGEDRQRCYDCDARIPQDEGGGCEVCQESFCNDCTRYSEVLALSLCDRCGVSARTVAGEDFVPADDAQACRDCEELWYTGELQQGLCPACWNESFTCRACSRRLGLHERSADEALCARCWQGRNEPAGQAVPAAVRD